MPMMALLVIHWSMASARKLYPSVRCITLALWHCQPLTRGRLWVIGFHSFSHDRSLVNVSILLMMWFDVLCVWMNHVIFCLMALSSFCPLWGPHTCQHLSQILPSVSLSVPDACWFYQSLFITRWVNSWWIVSIIDAWCSGQTDPLG